MATEEERIEQLEQQVAHLTRALEMVLEGRWTGDMPHAAAEVKAVDPTWEGEPVPFPKPRT